MNKITLPIGMHDKLFKRARVTYEIERDISDFLMAQGFNRIDTPTLEHFEVFSDHVEPIIIIFSIKKASYWCYGQM